MLGDVTATGFTAAPDSPFRRPVWLVASLHRVVVVVPHYHPRACLSHTVVTVSHGSSFPLLFLFAETGGDTVTRCGGVRASLCVCVAVCSVHVCHCHRLPKRQNKPSQDVVRPGTENAAGVGSGGKAGRRRKKAKATALFGRQRGEESAAQRCCAATLPGGACHRAWRATGLGAVRACCAQLSWTSARAGSNAAWWRGCARVRGGSRGGRARGAGATRRRAPGRAWVRATVPCTRESNASVIILLPPSHKSKSNSTVHYLLQFIYNQCNN